MIRTPFPEEVAAGIAAFAEISIEPNEALEFDPSESALPTPTSSVKRKTEFALGRRAAKKALRAAGLEPATLGNFAIIGTDLSGHPEWPPGFVGSIAHKGWSAVAVAGRSDKVWSLGVDLELPSARCLAILDRIASVEEKAWVNADPALAFYRAAVLFSMKESVYKALYPRCRKFIRFRDVEISPVRAEGDRKGENLSIETLYTVRLEKDLNGDLQSGFSFHAHAVSDQDHVVTGVLIRVRPPA